jgi:hypothetical protein
VAGSCEQSDEPSGSIETQGISRVVTSSIVWYSNTTTENAAFRELDLLPSAGGDVEFIYPDESVRKSFSQSLYTYVNRLTNFTLLLYWRWDNSVSTVTRRRVGRMGIDSWYGQRYFLVTVSRPALGLTQAHTKGYFPGDKPAGA